MGNKYIVSYIDRNGKKLLALSQKTNSGNVVLTTDVGEILAKIILKISFEDAIVLLDSDKGELTLQNTVNVYKSNDEIVNSITFSDCDNVLEHDALSAIRQEILKVIRDRGLVDLSFKKKVNKKIVKNNKHRGSIINNPTHLIALALAIGAFTYGTGFTSDSDDNIDKLPKRETYSSVGEFNVSESEPEIDVLSNKINISIPSEQNKVEEFEIDTKPVFGREEYTAGTGETVFAKDKVALAEENDNFTDGNYTSVYLEFEDLSGIDLAVNAKNNYYDLIEKEAYKFGLDPNLLMAMAIQEGGGKHSSEMGYGGAVGLMGIQYDVWIGNTFTYYELNEATGVFEKKSEVITDAMIRNLESNIRLGCIALQNALTNTNYNIPLAIQTYNMGLGNVYKILDAYNANYGGTRSSVINNPADTGWRNYVNVPGQGDPNYLQNTNKWADDNRFTVINVFNGEKVSVEFTNYNEELRKENKKL